MGRIQQPRRGLWDRMVEMGVEGVEVAYTVEEARTVEEVEEVEGVEEV